MDRLKSCPRWRHGLGVALTRRFAPASDETQLMQSGKMWGCLFSFCSFLSACRGENTFAFLDETGRKNTSSLCSTDSCRNLRLMSIRNSKAHSMGDTLIARCSGRCQACFWPPFLSVAIKSISCACGIWTLDRYFPLLLHPLQRNKNKTPFACLSCRFCSPSTFPSRFFCCYAWLRAGCR